MERRLSLRLATPLRLVARLLLALVLWQARPALADERLVLVVANHSPITTLSSKELHKMYLGLVVQVGERRVRPLRNDSDELMHHVFFQSIVSMSESTYDRRMLAQALQQGVVPPLLASTRAVFDQLASDPDAVSFAWAADVEKDPRVRAIRLLWHR